MNFKIRLIYRLFIGCDSNLFHDKSGWYWITFGGHKLPAKAYNNFMKKYGVKK